MESRNHPLAAMSSRSCSCLAKRLHNDSSVPRPVKLDEEDSLPAPKNDLGILDR